MAADDVSCPMFRLALALSPGVAGQPGALPGLLLQVAPLHVCDGLEQHAPYAGTHRHKTLRSGSQCDLLNAVRLLVAGTLYSIVPMCCACWYITIFFIQLMIENSIVLCVVDSTYCGLSNFDKYENNYEDEL